MDEKAFQEKLLDLIEQIKRFPRQKERALKCWQVSLAKI